MPDPIWSMRQGEVSGYPQTYWRLARRLSAYCGLQIRVTVEVAVVMAAAEVSRTHERKH
jgi:hypothetical protein